MKSSKSDDIFKGKDGQIASVGILCGNKLLMGKRRDDGRWTLPGGHMEAGENAKEGAVREVEEEAGIKFTKDQIELLESREVITWTGKELKIHAFKVQLDPRQKYLSKYKPKTENDPDKEVDEWEWIDIEHGLPKEVSSHLHSEKNVVLQSLGLTKSITDHKSQIMICDLAKSETSGHKYLRKYMHNGEWVYIYHEPNQEPRVLKEEAVAHIRRLAEMGHEHARRIIGSESEVNHEKVGLLQRLASLGNQAAKDELKRMFIPHIDDAMKKLKAGIEEARNRDPLDQPDPVASTALIEEAKKQVKDQQQYLLGYQDTDLYRKWHSHGISPESMTAGMSPSNSVLENLKKFHENLKKLETAHAGLTSRNADVTRAGGYAHLIWERTQKGLTNNMTREQEKRTAIKNLGDHMKELGSRHSTNFEIKGSNAVAEIRAKRLEKEAKEKKEKEEREKRELREIHGTMAHYMNSISATPLSNERLKEFFETTKRIFGKTLKKEDWPYNFEEHGYTTKIEAFSHQRDSISMSLSVFDKDGHKITEGWNRSWSKENGKPKIYNAYLVIEPSARGGVQIGNFINEGQRKLIAKVGGGVVEVGANIDVGGYNWANQGFSFDSTSALNDYRRKFQQFAREHGVNLSDEDMKHFKDPVHFAAFNNGKKYLISTSGSRKIKLSKSQLDSGSLSGIPNDNLMGLSLALTPEEKSSGKSNRMVVSLGKKFMLGKNWHGVWDSSKNTEASKYADHYRELKDRAVSYLNSEYQELLKKPVNEAVAREAAARTPSDSEVARRVNMWSRQGRVRMTPRRLAMVGRMTADQMNEFARTAPITRAARRIVLGLAAQRR